MNLQVSFYFVKVGFLPAVILTTGCCFTAFCSTSVGWIKTNGVIYIPIVFCPLTVNTVTVTAKQPIIALGRPCPFSATGTNFRFHARASLSPSACLLSVLGSGRYFVLFSWLLCLFYFLGVTTS